MVAQISYVSCLFYVHLHCIPILTKSFPIWQVIAVFNKLYVYCIFTISFCYIPLDSCIICYMAVIVAHLIRRTASSQPAFLTRTARER